LLKNIAFRRIVILIVGALVGVYGYVSLRGPRGLPALRDKWREIRKLEEDNTTLQRENDYRRERIKKLQSNTAEQELEIRKNLKMLRPGETTFILPEQPKQDAPKPTQPAESK
jgi:cell division protein FtsB